MKNKKESFKEVKKKNIEVVGLDINKENNPDVVHDLEKPIPLSNESFQQVTCIDSIEHIKNINNLFSEVYRILKKNGTLILSIPNTKFYRQHNHISYFTYKLIRQFISNSGLKKEKEIFFYFVPYLKMTIRVPFPFIASHFVFKFRKVKS